VRDPPRILVIDDSPDAREIVASRLTAAGYDVRTAVDGLAALDRVAADRPDLVLLDVMMPGIDGFETARRLKAMAGLPFTPIVLLTARTDSADVVAGLAAGADDYLGKPIDHDALLARVRAMLRMKALQDRVAAQAAELADWNGRLEARVAAQVEEIARIGRLRRFLAPQVADAILASNGDEAVLASHRRDVAVLFCDLRGFTAFAESAEPEDVMALLGDYHALVGERVFHHGGTIERFAGDAVMVVFNDPLPTPDYCRTAVALAREIVAGADALFARWRRRGAGLGLGIGAAAGFATLGRIGFGERFDYAAIGTVTNLASRLSGQAAPGQILVSARLAEAIRPEGRTRHLGDRDLRGFSRPVPVYELAE
jgi:class 3 adenylate cyclase/CheY-like chemotaxis protein